MVSPVLSSGYVSDDSMNSLIKGELLQNNQSLFANTNDSFRFWVSIGRFFPFALYFPVVFYYINSLLLYKTSILVLTVIDILVFGYFIKVLTQSKALSFLSILLPPLFFQFRLYHDPILSFTWLQQLLFLYIFTSLIMLIFYLRTRQRKFLILSLFTYLISLLTYEMTYIFWILHLLIIWFHYDKSKKKNIIKEITPFVLLTILIVLIPLFIRLFNGLEISGGGSGYPSSFKGNYIANLNVINYMATLIKQTIATFPLSYFIVDPHKIFINAIGFMKNHFTLSYVFLIIGYFVCMKQTINELTVKQKNSCKQLFIFGLALLVLPGALISLSPKYQNEVILGVGYIPVFISCFGLTLLTMSIIYMVFTKINFSNKKYLFVGTVAISLMFSLVGAINYNNNRIVVNLLNSYWLYPRTIIEDGLKSGLCQNIPDNSCLLVDIQFPWDYGNNPWVNTAYSWWERPAFYRMNSGLKVSYVGSNGKYQVNSLPSDALRNIQSNRYFTYDFSNHNNVVYLSFNSHSQEDGYAISGNIKNLLISNDKILGATASKAYIYIRTPIYPPVNKDISVSGLWIDKNKLNVFEPFVKEPEQMNLVSSGVDWKLYSISEADKLLDLKSLTINMTSRNETASVFGNQKV